MAASAFIGEILTLSATAVAAAAAYATFAAPRHKIRLKIPTPEAVVWALTLAYFLIFSALTSARHHGMATYGLDLGYYADAAYQFGQGRFFRQSLLPNEIFVNRCAPLLAVPLAPAAFYFFRRKKLRAGLICTALWALASIRAVFEIGWQYPLSILPFLYGAPAAGLRRAVRADACRRRRVLVTAESAGARMA